MLGKNNSKRPEKKRKKLVGYSTNFFTEINMTIQLRELVRAHEERISQKEEEVGWIQHKLIFTEIVHDNTVTGVGQCS